MATMNPASKVSQLPPKILTRIATFSVSWKNPDYDAWLKTRVVSRLFKEAVEKVFVEHCLKYTSLHYYLDADQSSRDGGINLAGGFDFKELDGNDSSRAVMAAPFAKIHKKKLHRAVKAMMEAENNDKTNLIITVRRNLSDIPLFHLKADYSSESEITLSFDWRAWFTVFMNEEKQLAPLNKNVLDDDPHATMERFKQQIIRGETTMEESLAKILNMAQGSKTNGYRPIRKHRQKRLIKIVEPEIAEDKLADMCALNEDRTMKRFGQMESDLVYDLEFSDESEFEGDDDDDDDDDDEEEEEEEDDDDDEEEEEEDEEWDTEEEDDAGDHSEDSD